ncbi:MAG: MFS transporter [Candidatus Latescibacterota bacterium]
MTLADGLGIFFTIHELAISYDTLTGSLLGAIPSHRKSPNAGFPMLARFSLYGFLKNQQYYDPFLILAFREKGLTFFQIGLLIGFREICINLLEIPSGAVADLYGRRRAMILSFSAYILSFTAFAISRTLQALFGAMLLFAIGEVFRTGTHKAMIFDWLRLQRRTHEKTKIYGYTRSWAKMGSALSVLIASALVFFTGKYSTIFWFSILPYLLNIVNLLGYPAVLDGDRKRTFSMKAVAEFLGKGLKQATQHAPLRRLIAESMGFEGLFKASKDYLQPILNQAAMALPLFLMLDDRRRAALLVGAVFFVLHILSSIASRRAHHLATWRGGEEHVARFIWGGNALLFACLIPLLYFRLYPLVIVCFVVLAITQNFWRPVMVSRINRHATPEMGATMLSIESQATSFATMCMAPLFGWMVDAAGAFWPVGVAGTVVTMAFVIRGQRSGTRDQGSAES